MVKLFDRLGEKIHKIKANDKNVDFPSQFCLAGISEKFDEVESCELSFKGNKSKILQIHNNLILKYNITMFRLIKKVFITKVYITSMSFSVSLACVAKVSDRTKCISLNDQPCLARSTLVDLNSNKLYYYPFRLSLGRQSGSCNTFHDFSNTIYVTNKTEDVNLNVFNTITRINESKTLTKYFSCMVNVNVMVENVIQIKRGIKNCVDVSAKIQ